MCTFCISHEKPGIQVCGTAVARLSSPSQIIGSHISVFSTHILYISSINGYLATLQVPRDTGRGGVQTNRRATHDNRAIRLFPMFSGGWYINIYSCTSYATPPLLRRATGSGEGNEAAKGGREDHAYKYLYIYCSVYAYVIACYLL